MRAVDVVREIAPRARKEYLAALDAGDAQLEEASITEPLRLAHLLAQCGGELLTEQPRQGIRARPDHEEDRLVRIVLRARGAGTEHAPTEQA